jgi:hypothetical protein
MTPRYDAIIFGQRIELGSPMKRITVWLSFLLTASSGFAGTPPLDPVLTVYESGFSSPLGVRHAGDGSGRLFVIQQGGIIDVIDTNGNALATPFLNIEPLTTGTGERGLLGLAFHPNYSSNGFFYVNYTNLNGDTTIARYTVSAGNSNIADSGSAVILLTINQDFSNHNGGDLHFGPDDFLYIGMGDGGLGDDPCDRGQTIDPADLDNSGSCQVDNDFVVAGGNPDSRALLGAMLRIDVDNPAQNVTDACGQGVNYGIPADNPFSGATAGCGEIWAWGLRNPYRFSFDRITGDLFIGDVGQGTREEIDFQPSSSIGGENYGWRCREGFIANPNPNIAPCNPQPVSVDPIVDYSHSLGRCSVTGGFRYRGEEVTWDGTYIYADYCSGELFYSEFVMGNWTTLAVLTDTFSNVTGFGEDQQGNLYYTNFNGEVVQITDGDFPAFNTVFNDGFED